MEFFIALGNIVLELRVHDQICGQVGLQLNFCIRKIHVPVLSAFIINDCTTYLDYVPHT